MSDTFWRNELYSARILRLSFAIYTAVILSAWCFVSLNEILKMLLKWKLHVYTKGKLHNAYFIQHIMWNIDILAIQQRILFILFDALVSMANAPWPFLPFSSCVKQCICWLFSSITYDAAYIYSRHKRNIMLACWSVGLYHFEFPV